MSSQKIAIIGTTRWGTTLGIVLAGKGLEVRLWARTEVEAARLNQERQNTAILPNIPFPPQLWATGSLEQALAGATLVVLAVPSQTMRANTGMIRNLLSPSMLIMSAAKGLELATGKRMSQVMSDELDPPLHPRICVLSGPNLSLEIARGLPATTVVAAYDREVAEQAQALLMAPNLRVYANTDVVGVELGGALKNIIALGVGMADGLGYGDNAKAALMTRGLAEMTRLGVAQGAKPLTFMGLAGVGDLIATCSSPLSRNRQVGQELAKGRPLEEIVASLPGVAEGINTTRVAQKLARELGVDMPITDQVYQVLFEGYDPRQAVAELMGRPAKHELAGIGGEAG